MRCQGRPLDDEKIKRRAGGDDARKIGTCVTTSDCSSGKRDDQDGQRCNGKMRAGMTKLGSRHPGPWMTSKRSYLSILFRPVKFKPKKNDSKDEKAKVSDSEDAELKTLDSKEAKKPVQWRYHVLQLVHDLAFITPGVEKALDEAFEDETMFELEKALKLVTTVLHIFNEEKRPEMIRRMHGYWEGLKMSDIPIHTCPESSAGFSDWPLKLFKAIYSLSEDLLVRYGEAVSRLDRSFQSAKRYGL